MQREKMNTCRIFAGKSEGKSPLGRSSCRWEVRSSTKRADKCLDL
jgi:hypothetical protein